MSCREEICRFGRFQRHNKLTRPAEFKQVFLTSCRSKDSHFVVLAINNGRGYARLGLVVSKKALRRAVDRNRMKRLIRESFRHHQKQLTGLDLIVMSHKNARMAANNKIEDSLFKHWNKIIRCKN